MTRVGGFGGWSTPVVRPRWRNGPISPRRFVQMTRRRGSPAIAVASPTTPIRRGSSTLAWWWRVAAWVLSAVRPRTFGFRTRREFALLVAMRRSGPGSAVVPWRHCRDPVCRHYRRQLLWDFDRSNSKIREARAPLSAADLRGGGARVEGRIGRCWVAARPARDLLRSRPGTGERK